VELVLCDDDPVPTLLAESRAAQLVVVGSRGLGVFRGMLLGAVSAEVVRSSSCSVLVLRDGTERAAG
jgi:nucleotide-binding universal stress UspA family protein